MSGLSLNQLLAYNTAAVLHPNDVVDIRIKRHDTYNMYAAVIPNDSCIVLVANNLDEVQEYLRKVTEITKIEKVNANVSEMPAQFRQISAYVAYMFGNRNAPLFVYNLSNGKWPAVNGKIDIREYIKCLM